MIRDPWIIWGGGVGPPRTTYCTLIGLVRKSHWPRLLWGTCSMPRPPYSLGSSQRPLFYVPAVHQEAKSGLIHVLASRQPKHVRQNNCAAPHPKRRHPVCGGMPMPPKAPMPMPARAPRVVPRHIVSVATGSRSYVIEQHLRYSHAGSVYVYLTCNQEESSDDDGPGVY